MARGRPRWRLLVLAFAVSLLVASCSLFRPERVAQRVRVTETVLDQGDARATTPGGPTGTSGPKVTFRPGSSIGPTTSKPNYASDDGVTAGEIRLGTIQPMDGPAAALGRPLYLATQAYINDLNARGGIRGRKVKLFLQTACINCEAENKLAAKTLVEDKHVFAIINSYMNTYAFSAAMEYLNAKRVPVVQGWTGVGDVRISWGNQQTPWSVYYTIRNDDAVRIYARWLDMVMAKWIAAAKFSNYHVATATLDVSQDIKRAQEFKVAWEALGGTHKVVSEQRIAAQEEAVTRMDSVVAAMKNAGANGVFAATNIIPVFGMQAAARQSWKVPWLTKGAWGRAATDNCGPACDGGYTDNNGWGWPGTDTPQMRHYKSVMARYYPDSTDDASTLGGWIGMQAFEYAASVLGPDVKRGPLMDILVNLRNFDTGIGSVINTRDSNRTAGSDPSADHLGQRQIIMVQMCGNKFYRVSDLVGPESTPRQLANSGSACGWGY